MSSRFDYVQYDEQAKMQQEDFKKQFLTLDDYVSELKDSREKSLVLNKLEEAYMWIGKAIRNEQITRNGSAQLQEERYNS